MSFAAARSRFAWVRPFCRQSPCLTQPGELGSSKLTKRYKPVRLRNCIGRDRILIEHNLAIRTDNRRLTGSTHSHRLLFFSFGKQLSSLPVEHLRCLNTCPEAELQAQQFIYSVT